MTIDEALYGYFSSFGLESYEEQRLPDGRDAPALPYLTYSVKKGCWADGALAASVNIHYRTDSERTLAEEALSSLSLSLGFGGRVISADGGGILLTRGKPFSNDSADSADRKNRCITVKLNAEFIM